MKVQRSKFNVQRLYFGYIIASITLFLYSYTQVDLSLTLSSAGILRSVQKAFQYVGFYQRPASTTLFVGIIGFWFLLYAIALRVAQKGQLSIRHLWSIVGAITILLVFSYPAFSYDLFNYVFTAKTVLLYHKNPYDVIPLQFASIDPVVAIMRWTHLPSAYTPIWIILTLPAYLLGFGKFLLIVWNLKVLVAAFYLFAMFGVSRVLAIGEPKKVVLGTAIFVLNPLVIIESLVSAHNDIVMMALAIWAIVLYLEKKYIASWLMVSASAAIKLMTIGLSPVLLTAYRRTINWRAWSLIAMLGGFFFVLIRREPLPWYWVWVAPFIALLPSKRWLTAIAGWYSFALLLRYAPYLYFGNWNAPVPILKWWVTIVPVGVSFAVLFLERFVKRYVKRDVQR